MEWFRRSTAPPLRVICDIIEVQGLVWNGKRSRLPSPFVDVRVGDASKSTDHVNSTCTCAFNKVFIFDDVPDDPDTPIVVAVCHKGFLSRDCIGAFRTTIGQISVLPNRSTPKSFSVPLTDPAGTAEPRGFIRLQVQILRSGESAESTSELSEDVSVSPSSSAAAAAASRLLRAPDLEFDKYLVNFNIFSGETVTVPSSSSSGNASPPSVFVRVRIGERVVTTAVVANSANPFWNECWRIPVSVPAISDQIIVELLNGSEGVGPDAPIIGSGLLSLPRVLNQGVSPTWVNLHNCTKQRGGQSALAILASLFERKDEAEAATAHELRYVGRLLVSASAVKCTGRAPLPLKPDKSSAHSVTRPYEVEHVLFIDVLDLSGLAQMASDITIEFSFGAWTHLLQPTASSSGLFDVTGRVPLQIFVLPVASSMLYDLFIRVQGRLLKTTRPPDPRKIVLALGQLSGAALLRQGNKPLWIELRPPQEAAPGAATAPISILLRAGLHKSTDNPVRPSWPNVETRRYKAVVTVVQATNLPIPARSFPSTYVSVLIGGVAGITRTVNKTINPAWHEVLQFDCQIPDDPTYARDVRVRVMAGVLCIGEVILPMEWVLSAEASTIKWFRLQSSRFPKMHACLLAAARLMEPEDDPPDALVGIEYVAHDIHAYIVGCRLFSSIQPTAPAEKTTGLELKLEFGRQPSEPNKRQWAASCDTVVRGARGNFDLFAPFDLQCYLPRGRLQQNFLDVKITAKGAAGAVTPLGTAFVHLTPLQPSVEGADVARRLTQRFAVHHPLRPAEDSPARLPAVDDDLFAPAAAQTSSQGGAEEQQQQSSAKEGTRWSRGVAGRVRQFIAGSDDARVNKAKGTDLYAKVSSLRWLDEGGNGDEFDEETAVSSTDGSGSRPQIDLMHPLEIELPLSRLPYQVVPIVGASRGSGGSYEVVGLLKVLVTVAESPNDGELTGRDSERALERIRAIEAKFRFLPPLKVRVHVLEASGLFPPMGQSSSAENTEWFLVLATQKTPNVTSGSHTVIDRGYKVRGMCPAFYRSFELDFTSPVDTFLCLGVACAGALWDSETRAGNLLIDLEDRWLHPDRLLFLPGPPPLETGVLKSASGDNVGRLQYYLEMLTADEAAKVPMKPLEIPQPQIVEVRVVIWQARGLTGPKGPLNPYVVASFPGSATVVSEESEHTPQETETVYRVADGNAVFNWRCVFRLTVPGDPTQLRLQLWSRNMLSAHEALGETLVELSSDLERVRSTKLGVELGRTWVRLVPPGGSTASAAGTNGHHTADIVTSALELEIALLSLDEAENLPVGRGREDPNDFPFLPPPREGPGAAAGGGGFFNNLADQTAFLSANPVAQTFFGTGLKVARWLKTIWICFVVICFTTFFYMFKKTFFSW